MSFTKNGDVNIKVLLIGDSGVGKSSLLHSFTSGTFDQDISTTIGIDFKTKKVVVMDEASGQRRHVNIQLWDTAGQERFRTLTSSYYRGAHAVVLVYDVTAPQTFYGLSKWLDEARSYYQNNDIHTDVVYLLIGNKVDQCATEDEMLVTRPVAESFARRHNMLFALTSAKTMHGVAQAFDEVARSVYDRLAERCDQVGSGRMRLNEHIPNADSSLCC